MENELVLELPTDVRSIEHAVEYVMQRCHRCGGSDNRLRLNFRVGLSEALANAMLYGNGHDPSKKVRVEVQLSHDRIEACVTDQGSGFDPSEVPDPTDEENLHRGGGRGLFLMRELMDEVSFNDKGNQVRLVLKLDDPKVLEGGAPA